MLDITAISRFAPYASGTLWIDGQSLIRRAVYALPAGITVVRVRYRYKRHDGVTMLSAMKFIDLLIPARRAVTRATFGASRTIHFPDKEFDPEYVLIH